MAAINCPSELVLRSVDVKPVMARLVVVAVPDTVSPPPAVPFPMVVEAKSINGEEVAPAMNGYAKVS